MNNDDLVVEFALAGESKNCYIFEPEEGGDVVSKLYVRKSSLSGKPEKITVTISEIDQED